MSLQRKIWTTLDSDLRYYKNGNFRILQSVPLYDRKNRSKTDSALEKNEYHFFSQLLKLHLVVIVIFLRALNPKVPDSYLKNHQSLVSKLIIFWKKILEGGPKIDFFHFFIMHIFMKIRIGSPSGTELHACFACYACFALKNFKVQVSNYRPRMLI